MLVKQVLRAIQARSSEEIVSECIIVNRTILFSILSKLNQAELIEILKTYGPYIPTSEKELDGEWCKEVRELLSISQEELAESCKVNQCDVSYLENERSIRIAGKRERKAKIEKELISRLNAYIKVS